MKSSNLLALGLPAVILCSPCWTGCSQANDKQEGTRTTVEFEPKEAEKGGPPPPSVPTETADNQAKKNLTTLIVLEDKRCTARECRPGPVIGKLKKTFGELKVVRHDWSSDECKRIFKVEKLRYLPVFLFDKSVKKNRGYARIKQYMVKSASGKMLVLKYPASFDPLAEICDNGKDDTGNGKVDCDDPTCKGTVICRKDEPKRLEVFTMSQCPFGTKALDSMEEVLNAFEDRIDFRVHYIASKRGDGFKSLHGQDEVDEDIRELCAIKHYPKNHKYMRYIWCRNRKIKDKNWKACTGGNGIEAEVIEKCFKGKEGKKLLAEDIKLAKELGVTASPTWLANNRFLYHAIAPESIKAEFCKHNKGLKGCEKRLSTESPVPANAVCK